jgi:hypothetical protein
VTPTDEPPTPRGPAVWLRRLWAGRTQHATPRGDWIPSDVRETRDDDPTRKVTTSRVVLGVDPAGDDPVAVFTTDTHHLQVDHPAPGGTRAGERRVVVSGRQGGKTRALDEATDAVRKGGRIVLQAGPPPGGWPDDGSVQDANGRTIRVTDHTGTGRPMHRRGIVPAEPRTPRPSRSGRAAVTPPAGTGRLTRELRAAAFGGPVPREPRRPVRTPAPLVDAAGNHVHLWTLEDHNHRPGYRCPCDVEKCDLPRCVRERDHEPPHHINRDGS